LINYLEAECRKKGCDLFVNEPVTQVDWEKNNVTVYTSGSKKFFANKCILTVPVSILGKTMARASINFTPPMDEQVKAAQQIGFGTVIKIILEFKRSFWEEDCHFVFSDEIIPTWWTQLPDKTPILTGWVGGTKAERLSDESDAELLEKALLSLAAIFEKPLTFIKGNLVVAKVFNWQKEKGALGAYSFSMPQTTAARKLLTQGVEETIFFAGESVHDGEAPGTVEAAIINAKEIAGKLRKK
jgi:monoamine oxidase